MTSCTCSWCGTLAPAGTCPNCGHDNERSRLDCDCPQCGRLRRPGKYAALVAALAERRLLAALGVPGDD